MLLSLPMLLRPRAAQLIRPLHLHPCTSTPFRPRLSIANMPLRAKLPGEQRKSMATKAEKAVTPLQDHVLFHTNYGVRAIELNRPEKFNALSGDMAVRILERLREYEKSQLANIIIIKGSGDKAFCAGGDIDALAQQNFPTGNLDQPSEAGMRKSAEYFKTEYTLDHLIATYSKPYVAFMDGATMGGGVGLSLHAPFRIATERTVFAMPESKIGFFTDVGGSFFLPRLDGQLGTYLALTGETLIGVDTLYAGIATHYIHSTTLPSLEQRLSELQFPDSSTLEEKYEVPRPHAPLPDRVSIDQCFAPPTLSGILTALSTHESTSRFIRKTHNTILTRCPLSVVAILTLLRAGKYIGITTAFQHEAVVASRFMRSKEFYIGVKNLLWDKRKEMPNWPGPSITELAGNPTMAEKLLREYVDVRPGVDERLALDRGTDYTRYPHWWVGLPSEEEIRKKVEEEGRGGRKWGREDVVAWFVEARRGKVGVKGKVEEVLGRKTVEENGGVRWVHEVDRFA
ncbi:ClpP/crotonase-like domain-containing protein [Terfezia claveryi]|nr:ClpP/crotonase-like domain-containing protein [Terfezia claveryi]